MQGRPTKTTPYKLNRTNRQISPKEDNFFANRYLLPVAQEESIINHSQPQITSTAHDRKIRADSNGVVRLLNVGHAVQVPTLRNRSFTERKVDSGPRPLETSEVTTPVAASGGNTNSSIKD